MRLQVPRDAAPLLLKQRTQYYEVLNQAYTREMEDLFANIKPVLPDTCSSFLDVGAGLAGIDAFVSAHYRHSCEVCLLDKEQDDSDIMSCEGWHDQAETFGFYSSRRGAQDLLMKAGVQKSNISFLGSMETLPQQDLVLSFLSWGFHYPVDTYLDQVVSLLVPGGVLILDLRKDQTGSNLVLRKFDLIAKLHEAQKYIRYAFRKPQEG